jgi:hypothetical protein
MSSDVQRLRTRMLRELAISVLLYAALFFYTVSVLFSRHDWALAVIYLLKGTLLASTYLVATRKPITGSASGDEAVVRKGYACIVGFILFSAISDYAFLLALRHNNW